MALTALLWLAMGPSRAMAQGGPPSQLDVDRQVGHINALLVEHPHVMDFLGGVVTELAVDGSRMITTTYYPERDQNGGGTRWSAEIAHLESSIHVPPFGLAGPYFPCRSEGPLRKVWRKGCWYLGGETAGLDPVNMWIEFDADEPTAAAINIALEDLFVMLQERELAGR